MNELQRLNKRCLSKKEIAAHDPHSPLAVNSTQLGATRNNYLVCIVPFSKIIIWNEYASRSILWASMLEMWRWT